MENNNQAAERLVRQAAEQEPKLFSCLNYLNVPISVRSVSMTTTSMPSRYPENTAIQHFKVVARLRSRFTDQFL